MAAVKPPVPRTASTNPRMARRAVPARTFRRPRPPNPTALRAAVDEALERMREADVRPSAELPRELISTLRVGLALTSATGDTCRLPADAVTAVRDAIGSLEHADLGTARTALATAHGKLIPNVPRQAGPVDP
jgi:hypothetical protein